MNLHRKEGGCIFNFNSYSYKDDQRYRDFGAGAALGMTLESLQEESGINIVKKEIIGREKGVDALEYAADATPPHEKPLVFVEAD